MPKVLISDKMSDQAREIFVQRGVGVDVKTGLTPEALQACIAEYDGLAIRSTTKATAAIINAASNLKVIGRAGIGVDNVDIPAATARGIVVMNTPFGNAVTTAEHAIAMLFALARQIPQANASTHAGKWEKSKFMGTEVTGKTLGLIGCGNIGSIVASRALGLKMKVVAFDPFLSSSKAQELGIEKVELPALFKRADFITLHTPLNDSTRHIINAAAISQMKKGVYIINCARGGLIVESDLLAALDSGHVAGAALDVFEEEPAKSNPLFGHDNVVCTPHLGASTTEAQENVALQVAEQMADYLLTGAITNAVNTPSLTAEEAGKLQPYLKLAHMLGSFAGQVTESGVQAIAIEYAGAVAELNTKPLTAAITCAFLSPLLSSVNPVNALMVAKERTIALSETRHAQRGEYDNSIRLTITTDKRTRSIMGTVFGDQKPRLVDVEGMAIDAELKDRVLFVRNLDKPGFIGSLGQVLGNAGINIATFNLGRVQAGADAIALIEIDQPVPAPIIQQIAQLPHVVQVKLLEI